MERKNKKCVICSAQKSGRPATGDDVIIAKFILKRKIAVGEHICHDCKEKKIKSNKNLFITDISNKIKICPICGSPIWKDDLTANYATTEMKEYLKAQRIELKRKKLICGSCFTNLEEKINQEYYKNNSPDYHEWD